MTSTRYSLLAALALLAGPAVLGDDGDTPGWKYDEAEGLRYEAADGGVPFRVENRGQVRFVLDDPEIGDSRGSFDVARYKLTLSGEVFGNWDYRLQADLAGGSESSSELLEDAFFRYTWHPLLRLWVGQGRVAFGRQELTSSADLQFVERSIASERFAHGRDVGIALGGTNRNRTYEYSVGIYNGNGINKDEGDNIDYLVAGRLTFTPFGEYALDESDLDRPERSRLAIGVSALGNTTGTEGFEEERVSRGGLEIAYKRRGVSLVAEFFTESADILLAALPSEEVDTDGWYLQSGYLWPGGFELAGRFSEIVFEEPMLDRTEVGLAFGYHFAARERTGSLPVRRGNKIQIDYRRLEFEEQSGAEEAIDRDELRVQLQFVF